MNGFCQGPEYLITDNTAFKGKVTEIQINKHNLSPSSFTLGICVCMCVCVCVCVTYLPDKGFPGGSEGKASACNAGDQGLIPGLGRSPGQGNGNPLQYSCLVNPMDRGAWWATVHRVAKSRT